MKPRGQTLLDILCKRYPEKTREQHLAGVLCGDVYAGGERVRDPKRRLAADAAIEFKPKAFVSRGGEKLDYALAAWNVDAAGKTVLDAGSSTGGFTHCLLKRGAARVHAVDAGYNQMHPALRTDPRVILKEETSIMSINALDPVPAFAVCDLSFRSLRCAARHILCLTSELRLIALVKPQFEWENPPAEFDGVVRGEDTLREILLNLTAALKAEGVYAARALESPLRGASGNREFLFDLSLRPYESSFLPMGLPI
ncbi:MAG: TlyA family RNA methyltransferase [Spirochaetales bacterium]|jgi:23S rRNA (cytidine1920-2'-O)/16S rRNA (cytidine1409-2'-O)-methyltransferase|nr:TlyA family RNA methyltransferase [Spirochaetales bacterium]